MRHPWLDLTPWADRLTAGGSWLLLVGIRSTLVLGTILIIGTILRKSSSTEQKLIYRGGLVAGTLLLFCSLTGWRIAPTLWSVPVPPRVQAPTPAAMVPSPAVASSAVGKEWTALRAPNSSHNASWVDTSAVVSGPRSLAPSLAFAVWAAGVLVLLLRLGWGLHSIAQLRRRCVPCQASEILAQTSDLSRAGGLCGPELLVGECVGSPMVVGPFRPALLLPTTLLDGFSSEQQRAVLAHEFGHLRGRDLEWGLLTRLLCVALWFQPLVWMLAARLDQANEEASDAAALEAGCSRQDYAALLISLAERLLSGAHAAPPMGIQVVPIRSSVGRRITMLFSSESALKPGPSRGFRLGIGLGSLAVVVLSTSLGAAAPPPAVTLEHARKEASFPVIEPRGLPAGATLEAVRVYKIRMVPVQNEAASPPEPMRGYGLSVRPDGKRVWIQSRAHSVAAHARIPSREVELLQLDGKPLGGPFPVVRSPPIKHNPPPHPAQVPGASGDRLTALLARFRKEPLTVTYRDRNGKIRTVTLAKRELMHFPNTATGYFPERTAVLSYSVGGKPFTLFQIPPVTQRHLMKVLRPLTLVDDAAQLIEFKSASRARVGKVAVWTLGPEEAPSVFWSAGGIDFWLENRDGALTRAEVLAFVQANAGR